MVGLSSKAIEKISASPKELAMLSALVKLMDALSTQARAERTRTRLGVKQAIGPKSAEELARSLEPEEHRLHAYMA